METKKSIDLLPAPSSNKQVGLIYPEASCCTIFLIIGISDIAIAGYKTVIYESFIKKILQTISEKKGIENTDIIYKRSGGLL